MADNNSINILIKALLQKTSKQDLENELKQIEKKLKPVNIEVNTNSETQIKLSKSLQKIYKEEEKQRLIQEKYASKGLADKEKQLQYEQKVRQAIEQTKQSQEKITKELQQQIQLFQKKIQLESQRVTGKYGSLVDNNSLSSVVSNVDSFNVSTPDVQNKMKQATLGMKEVELQAKNSSKAFKGAQQDAISWSDELIRSGKKFTEWYLLAGGITGVIGAIKNGVSYLIDLDNSLNEIRIVTNKTQIDVDGLAKSYNNLAKEMKVTTKEVASTAADLYRQGLNDSEVEDRMKSIITYAKISSISLADSNKIITATANATGESVEKIINIFAILGDSTASGADEIGEALQKVASSAENSGVVIEKASSWIATISSKTRESAAVVGNSLKSLMARYESIKSTGFNSEDATKLNDVTEALTQVGIRSVDSAGQLRPFADVMDDLGKKYSTLNANEKAYITTTLGGTFQRNRLITLLNNYNDSLKNYETALNSSGVAQQKFNIYQESSKAKLDTLTASFEGLAQKTINSGLIKFFLDFSNVLVNILSSDITKFIVTTGLLSASIYGVGLAFNTVIGTQFAAKFVSMLSLMTSSTLGFSVGLKALTTAMLASPLFGITVASLGIVGVIKFVDYLNGAYDRQVEKLATVSKEYDTLKGSLSSIEKELDGVQSKIDQLQSKGSLTIYEEKELTNLQNVNEQLKIQIANEQELLRIKGEDKEKQALKVINSTNKTVRTRVEDIQNADNFYGADPNALKKVTETQYIKEQLKIYDELSNKISRLKGNEKDYVKVKEDLQNQQSKVHKEIVETNAALQKNGESIIGVTEEGKKQKKSLDDISVAVLEHNKNLSGSTTAINNNKKVIEESSDGINNYKKVQESFDKTLEKSTKNLDDFQSSAKNLSSTYEDLNDGEKISSDTLLNLIQLYPQYASQIANMNNSKEDAIKLTNVLFEAEKQKTIAKLENDRRELNSEIFKISSIKKAYEAYLATSPDGNLTGREENSLNKLIDKDPLAKSISNELNGITTAIDILKNSTLPDFTSSKKDSTSPTDKNPEKYKLEKDRYLGLNQALSEINNSIEYNKTLQEQAGNENIELLDQEIKLLEMKRKAINDIAWERGQEANSLKSGLEGYGITDANSYDTVITSMVDRLNGMKSGDAYDAFKTEIDNLKSSYQRYIELVQTEIPKSTIEMTKLGTEIAKVENDKIAISFKLAEKAASGLNQALEETDNKLKGIADDDLEGKIKAYSEQQKAANDLLWYWNEQMELFAEGSDEWLKARDNANKFKDTIDSAKVSILELNKKTQEGLQKQYEEKLKSYNEVEDQIVDMLKQKYEKQDELAEKSNKAQEDRLDESLNNYKNHIQAQIDELDRLRDAENYNDDVDELNKDILENQQKKNKFNLAAKSGDMESISRVKELDEKIDEDKKQLAKKQKDREFNLRKENLQDMLKNYEDYISAEKKKNENSLESAKARTKELMDDNKLKFEAQNLLITGSLETTKTAVVNLFTITGNNATNAGKVIENTLLSKLSAIRNVANEMSKISNGTAGNNPLGMNTEDFSTYLSNKKAFEDGNITDIQRQQNADLRKKYGISNDSFSYNDLKGYYANGGISDFTGKAMLHGTPNSVETIFNATQGKKLFDFVSSLPSNISNIMPKINIPKFTPISPSGGINVTFDSLINVGNLNGVSQGDLINMTKSAASEAVKTIKFELTKAGQYRR